MKKIHIIIALAVLVSSCRKTNITEVRPLNGTTADTTQVLLVEDRYPCMKLMTEDVIPLPISLTESDATSPRIHVHYIALETTEDCLIGNIEKIESDDSCIFIFDKTNCTALRFSQKDGTFLNTFGTRGRGPGEYVQAMDMSLDRENKELCLYDQFGYKNLFFSYDGKLVREEPLFYFYNAIEFAGGCRILHTDLNDNESVPAVNGNRLVVADNDQTPRYVAFSFPKSLSENFNQSCRYPLITCGNEVYFTHTLSDTIWQIRPDGICEAKYVFKFPNRDNLFDEQDYANITNEQYGERTAGIPHYRDNCTITNDFVMAQFLNNPNILYCKTTGNIFYGKPFVTRFGIGTTISTQFTLNGSSFVQPIEPFKILQNHRMEKEERNEFQYNDYWNNQLTEEERQLLSTMTEEDNPILMIMDIEPF